MKRNGVVCFEQDGVKIVVQPGFNSIGSNGATIPPVREYTEEELLFAHTEGLPD